MLEDFIEAKKLKSFICRNSGRLKSQWISPHVKFVIKFIMGQSCMFEEEKLNWIWTSRDSESFKSEKVNWKLCRKSTDDISSFSKFFFVVQKHCKTELRYCN